MSRSPRATISGLLLCLVACSSQPKLPPATTHVTSRVALVETGRGNLVLFRTPSGAALIDTRLPAAEPGESWQDFEPLLGRDVPTPKFVIRVHGRSGRPNGMPAECLLASRRLAEWPVDVELGGNTELEVDGYSIHCYYKGRTYGRTDCVVYLPRDQVLIVGGLVAGAPHAPTHDSGSDLRAWVQVLRGLAKDFKDASRLKVVPTHGPVVRADALLKSAELLDGLLRSTGESHRHGLSLQEAREDVAALRKQHSKISDAAFDRTFEQVYAWVGAGN